MWVRLSHMVRTFAESHSILIQREPPWQRKWSWIGRGFRRVQRRTRSWTRRKESHQIGIVEPDGETNTENRRERVILVDSGSISSSSSSSSSCTMILVVVAPVTSSCSGKVVGCTLLRWAEATVSSPETIGSNHREISLWRSSF